MNYPDSKIKQYRQMLSQQQESIAKRESIKLSQEYIDFSENIKALEEDKRKLLSGVIDYSEELRDLEQEIIEEMKAHGITGTNEVDIKYKESKKVNVLGLKYLLDDEDLFMTLAEVPQSKLKEFAKENPERKKEIMSCVEVVKREAVGLILKY